VAFVTLGYPDGVLGHVHVSWADPNKTREVVVVCEEKRIVFNDLDSLEPVRVFEKGVRRRLALNTQNLREPVFALREGRIVSPVVEPAEPLMLQCEHFVRCVETGAQPLTDGYAGLSVVRAMEALDRSLELSGTPVPLADIGVRQGVERDARSIG
jgi:predicted dehydrogenase